MTTLELSTDAQLLSRSQTGDHSAFACLVDRHKHQMVGYLTRITGDRDRAEDLAQEVFVRLYSKRRQYTEEGKLTAYLYRIATNLVRSQYRREQRWKLLRPLFSQTDADRSEPDPQARAIELERSDRLRAAVAELPVRYRVPLILHELEERPYREIADLLNCNIGTVKSRIHRGRNLLRQQLGDDLAGGAS